MMRPSRVLAQVLAPAGAILALSGCVPDPGTPFDAKIVNDSTGGRVVYACLDDSCITGAPVLHLPPSTSGLVNGNFDYAVHYGIADFNARRIACFDTMTGDRASKVYRVSAAIHCPNAKSDSVTYKREDS